MSFTSSIDEIAEDRLSSTEPLCRRPLLELSGSASRLETSPLPFIDLLPARHLHDTPWPMSPKHVAKASDMIATTQQIQSKKRMQHARNCSLSQGPSGILHALALCLHLVGMCFTNYL